jgi:signal transduction histidine kinase
MRPTMRRRMSDADQGPGTMLAAGRPDDPRQNGEPRKSLQARFLAFTLCSTFAILVAFFAYLEVSQYRAAGGEIDDRLGRMLESSSLLLAEATLAGDAERMLLLLAPVLGDPDVQSIAVDLADGTRVAAHGVPLDEVPPDLVRRHPIINVVGGQPVRIGWVVAAVSHHRIDGELRDHLFDHIVLALLIFAAIVIGIQQSLQPTVMRPMRRLLAAIQGWEAGATPTPVAATRNDEFGRLIRAFNGMQRRQLVYQEDLRVARDTAEAADRTKTAFLAIMSHELRTPLNAIIGFSELLKTIVNTGGAARGDYLDAIIESSHKLLDLVNDILDVTHAYGGRLKLVERALSLHDVVERVLAACRNEPEKPMPRIENAVPESLPELVADRDRVMRALTHLVANAVRFTSTEGTVTVDAAETRYGLRLRVIDTGAGITSERLAQIQRPFAQAPEDWQHHSAGAGLGLTYAKTIARLHGGEFAIESTAGEGTRAILTFPATRLSRPVAVRKRAATD